MMFFWHDGKDWYFGPDENDQRKRWPCCSYADCLASYLVWKESQGKP
jgi:hypothetical protein